MHYAIIKSGSDGFLKVIKLSDWFDYEWDDFTTVKSKEDGDIKWFWDEGDAVDFMIENFPRTMISSEYFKETSFNGEYYID